MAVTHRWSLSVFREEGTGYKEYKKHTHKIYDQSGLEAKTWEDKIGTNRTRDENWAALFVISNWMIGYH